MHAKESGRGHVHPFGPPLNVFSFEQIDSAINESSELGNAHRSIKDRENRRKSSLELAKIAPSFHLPWKTGLLIYAE